MSKRAQGKLVFYDLHGEGVHVQILADAKYDAAVCPLARVCGPVLTQRRRLWGSRPRRRVSTQDFDKIHSTIKRGDIVGVTGYPGTSPSPWPPPTAMIATDAPSHSRSSASRARAAARQVEARRAVDHPDRDHAAVAVPAHAAERALRLQGQCAAAGALREDDCALADGEAARGVLVLDNRRSCATACGTWT